MLLRFRGLDIVIYNQWIIVNIIYYGKFRNSLFKNVNYCIYFVIKNKNDYFRKNY